MGDEEAVDVDPALEGLFLVMKILVCSTKSRLHIMRWSCQTLRSILLIYLLVVLIRLCYTDPQAYYCHVASFHPKNFIMSACAES